ncbi:hypothetical protein M1P56_32565 [Streptomyces sp. HU2014]|uniref:hypothetical protein n=1 Tax=Streptomyces sp. HU2014 TaxID=2939414 RepID=UPI00200F4A9E|nr:hypothetical protein [Streptomyces sp. HU2014]UQI48713.1 hypothetical protein M1P56_32565 [Streptomyces sp. HU2014]
MVTRRSPARKPVAKRCPDCKGVGEITETVRVGPARKRRDTGDQQTALCLTCFGSGLAPTD